MVSGGPLIVMADTVGFLIYQPILFSFYNSNKIQQIPSPHIFVKTPQVDYQQFLDYQQFCVLYVDISNSPTNYWYKPWDNVDIMEFIG